MVRKVLIANRGEIAPQEFQRACKENRHRHRRRCTRRRMPNAMHVRLADREAGVHRPPPPAAESYLNIPRLLARLRDQPAPDRHPSGLRLPCRRMRAFLPRIPGGARSITFIGPTHLRAHPPDGATKIEGQGDG